MLVLEPAKDTDLRDLARLAADNLAGEVDPATFADVKARVWVARDVRQGNVVGFAACARQDSCHGRLLALAVSPVYRSRGLGSALLKNVQQDLMRQGAMRMHLDVRADDLGAQEFYVRHGYQPTGLGPRAYSDGGDAVHMERPL